jgi:hypothetical protein
LASLVTEIRLPTQYWPIPNGMASEELLA